MPFTFAHPAVILPLLKSNRFSSTALIIGSIVPDFEFFLQLREVPNIGHKWYGLFLFDFPLSIMISFIFHNWLRNNFIQKLPFYFRTRLISFEKFDWNLYAFSNKIKVTYSFLLGIITHLIWDGFTHYDGFFIALFPLLLTKIEIQKNILPVYFLLQLLFSIVGLAIVAYYFHKMKTVRVENQSIEKSYWLKLGTFALIIFCTRVIFWPEYNSFWGIFMAGMGSIIYSSLIISIITKFSKAKSVLCVLGFCIITTNIHSQTKTPLDPKKREAFITKASEFRKTENYYAAIIQLDSILKYNTTDAAILLFKGDLQLQSKRFKQAVATYSQLLPLQYEKTITQINLSYALFMNHKPANALNFAKKAWLGDANNTNAVVNYFNAMLWNLDTKNAAKFLDEQNHLLSAGQNLVLKARLYTSSGDFKNGLIYYDSLTKSFPEKYYVQEYAEVLLGKKEIKESVSLMKTHKNLFSVNEYKIFEEKVYPTSQQNAGTEMIYFTDIAKNKRIENNIWWQQNENRKYRFRVGVGTATITSASSEKTNAQFATVNIAEKWNSVWSGETNVNLQLIQPKNSVAFTAVTGQQSVLYKPNDRKMVGLSYNTEILNFTASLLEKNIRSNNIGYITHLMLNGKSGFYSQGSAGILTNQNRRLQFFGSFYKLFRTEPTLKVGLNFSGLHFSNNKIVTYFSPNKYLNTEVFTDFSTSLPMLAKFYFQVQAAAGIQKIEAQKWDAAFRLQSQLGYRTKHLETSLKFQSGNVASATGTGYSFNQYSIRFGWKW